MASPSLYRRHRPRTFADVVGQEHVVRTLTNAVEQGKVHHAYLFVGSRGTGKTSMAKILAACLNCEQGPTTTPDGTCESCRAIAAATSMDVIEMDAASNNSVDDVRDLRERVALAPVSGRKKVYILDEAHMLTPAAWNAFLKTLEEPPPDTVFVLATTEAQKVLPTVVDRCHRFDFRRPRAAEVGEVVERAARAESIAIAPEAVALLARHASGSFRDALGTLEQLVTYAGAQAIAVQDVLAVLGIADAEALFEAMDAVAAGDVRRVLLAVERLDEAGRDPRTLLSDLEAHARDLLYVRSLGGEVPAQLAVTPERDRRLAEQARVVGGTALVRVLEGVGAALAAEKAGADARTQLELCLVKAAAPELDPSVRALQARLERLERGAPASASTGAAAPAPTAVTPAAPVAATPPAPPAVASVPVAAPSAPTEVAVAAGAAPPADVPPPTPAAPPVANGDLELSAVVEAWPAVVDALREAGSPRVASNLERATPVAVEGGELRAVFPKGCEFVCRQMGQREDAEAVTAALRAVLGVALRPDYRTVEVDEAPQVAAATGLDEDELIARLTRDFDATEIEEAEA